MINDKVSEIVLNRTQQEIVRKAKLYGGNNLQIPHRVNKISPECEDLLKRMLTYNPNQRIGWQQFFKHKLFDEKLQYNQPTYNPLGSTMHFAQQMNKRFEGYRMANAPAQDYIEEQDDINDLINQKGEGQMESIDIINEEEVVVSDDVFEKLISEEQADHENEQFQDIEARYNFEREKIELMRRVSCDLFY